MKRCIHLLLVAGLLFGCQSLIKQSKTEKEPGQTEESSKSSQESPARPPEADTLSVSTKKPGGVKILTPPRPSEPDTLSVPGK